MGRTGTRHTFIRAAAGVLLALSATAVVGRSAGAESEDPPPAPADPAPGAEGPKEVAAPTPADAPLTESPLGRYIVRFRSSDAYMKATTGPAPIIERSRVGARYNVVFPGLVATMSFSEAQALQANPLVAGVYPDHIVSLEGTQTSPPSWGLDRIDQTNLPLDNSYTYPNTGAGVMVFVLDSGVDQKSDFAVSVNAGIDYIDGGRASDCQGHGTHVAGTIGSTTYGVAKGVMIVPIRVLDCDGQGTTSDVIAGIQWAMMVHSTGPAVLNASIGGTYDSSVNLAIEAAVSDGISVVVAAGNSADDACTYSPSSAQNAITVGATAGDDYIASFSNYGSCVDIFAPGYNIKSLLGGNNVDPYKSGTSMASPHVAGVAAILLAQYPTMTPAQVRDNIVGASIRNTVHGYISSAPNRLLHIPNSMARPINDSLVNARPFNIWGYGSLSNTMFATHEGGEPLHHGLSSGAGSVWYRLKSPVSGFLELSTSGSNFDTLLAVYTGTSVGALTEIASDDDSGGSLTSYLSFPVVANTTYWVAIDGFHNHGDAYLTPTFSPTSGPPNDYSSAAISVSPARDSIIDAHSRGATHEAGEPQHAGKSGIASTWWSITPPAAGRLLASSQGSAFDTTIGVYTTPSAGVFNLVGSNDDTNGLRSQVFAPVSSGTQYKVAVDGYSSDPVTGNGAVQLHTAFISNSNGWYAPLAVPVRLMDTRAGQRGALEQAVDSTTPFGAGEVRRYVVTGVSGLGTAAVAALNVTTLHQALGGYLSIYPCASTADAAPSTSAINFQPSQTIANSAMVGLSGGGFCVYSSRVTDVIVDATGAYNDANDYTTLSSPARLFDTRPGKLGLVETPTDESTPYAPGEIRRYTVPNAGGIPAPSGLSAVAVNLTAVGPSANGFLKAWPCSSISSPAPDTSTLNYRALVTVANAGVLGVATNGGICVQSSQTANVILDVTGWYKLYGSTVSNARPLRLFDTRPGEFGTAELSDLVDSAAPFAANTTYRIQPQMQAGVPGGTVANSVVLNITAVSPVAEGYVTIWPCTIATQSAPPPLISALNFRPGGASANGAIVGLSSDGFCLRVSQTTHLIVDVTGWQATAF